MRCFPLLFMYLRARTGHGRCNFRNNPPGGKKVDSLYLTHKRSFILYIMFMQINVRAMSRSWPGYVMKFDRSMSARCAHAPVRPCAGLLCRNHPRLAPTDRGSRQGLRRARLHRRSASHVRYAATRSTSTAGSGRPRPTEVPPAIRGTRSRSASFTRIEACTRST